VRRRKRPARAAIEQISENAGVDGAVIAQKVKKSSEVNFGYGSCESSAQSNQRRSVVRSLWKE
jgi:hypothetical protein